jgi:hypothetical protein
VKATTTGGLVSLRDVSSSARQSVMHPNAVRELIEALRWAVDESDRLADQINKAGLYITKVDVTLPSQGVHHVRVAVSGAEAS